MNDELFNLKGKIAVITDAGSGIGRGISETFARMGANIVVAEINPETAKETVDIVTRLGREAIVVHTDVTKEVSVNNMLKVSLSTFGKMDILVNNVGGLAGRGMIPIVEMTLGCPRF